MATIHEEVRERYARAAKGSLGGAAETHRCTCGDEASQPRGTAQPQEAACCGAPQSHESEAACSCGTPTGATCSCGAPSDTAESAPIGETATGASCCSSETSTAFGYTIAELASLPDGADLALGCGNPTAIAELSPGERVLDLGSGGGIDCFLAAARVGETGHVIGVDMTPPMIELARRNAEKAKATNVEFRLGEIEHLPVADASVDVIISNCVINLAPDKRPVLAEAFRVLAPGGRISVSDLVLDSELEERLRGNLVLLTGCIAGAMLRDSFLEMIADAGFEEVTVARESDYLKLGHLAGLAAQAGISQTDAEIIAGKLHSATITARKPR